jgi:hypothetical protein
MKQSNILLNKDINKNNKLQKKHKYSWIYSIKVSILKYSFSSKIVNSKYNISFIENILYWLWYYGKKIKAIAPWNGAWIISCILTFLNLAFIPFIILNIMDCKFNVLLYLYIIIIAIYMIKYNSKKYCTIKDKRTNIMVWDDNHCILTEKYDNMSNKQRRKHKRIFIIYVVSTIAVTVVTLLIFL